MSTRKTPKSKAAAGTVPPASPARQSRRIRGVQAELDLNALEEIEKRNRRSRSRSRSTSVSSQVLATPRKDAGGDESVTGKPASPHVDFDQTVGFSDASDREVTAAGGDTLCVNFDASADFDVSPVTISIKSQTSSLRKRLSASSKLSPAAAQEEKKSTGRSRRGCPVSSSTAADDRTAVEEDKTVEVVSPAGKKKISVSPSKKTNIKKSVDNVSTKTKESTEVVESSDEEEEEKVVQSAKKKVSTSPVKKTAIDADDETKKDKSPTKKRSSTSLWKSAAITESLNEKGDEEETEVTSISPSKKQKVFVSPTKTAVEPTSSDEEEEEDVQLAKKNASISTAKNADAKQSAAEEDDEEEDDEEDEPQEDKEIVYLAKKKASCSPAKKADSKQSVADEKEETDEEEEPEEIVPPAKKCKVSASPTQKADVKKPVCEDEDVDKEDEDVQPIKTEASSASKRPAAEGNDEGSVEAEDEEDLFDDANSTMDVDDEEENEEEELEAKVRRRNRFYEEDLEDAAVVEQRRKKYKKSVVDDEFFRLEEMNEFLDAQDRLDAKYCLGKFDAADQMADLIEHYETENLQPRTWELAGEVSAETRDKNTLLDNFVDADFQSKAAPTITSQITEHLESIILKRIKDKLFDDVERKQRRDDLVANYRAKTTFDETVRRSLADVYEEEFQAAQTEKDVDEQKMDPVVTEIKKDMDALFAKLDALSHYQFVPSKVRPEVKIVKNVASLRAEEVGPMASTAAADALLAPEEVADHLKAAPKAADERDATDRKRLRRKKKLKQKALAKKGLMNKEDGKNVPNGFRIKKTIVKKGKVLVKGKFMKKRKAAADED